MALELFNAGNQEFAESRFAQALGKYREAIEHWDHPAIRFNITVVLINLDQLVEARENLVRTLVHGAAPLSADAYARAQTYQKALDAQLGHVRITCQELGATVTLDGKLLSPDLGLWTCSCYRASTRWLRRNQGSSPRPRRSSWLPGS